MYITYIIYIYIYILFLVFRFLFFLLRLSVVHPTVLQRCPPAASPQALSPTRPPTFPAARPTWTARPCSAGWSHRSPGAPRHRACRDRAAKTSRCQQTAQRNGAFWGRTWTFGPLTSHSPLVIEALIRCSMVETMSFVSIG